MKLLSAAMFSFCLCATASAQQVIPLYTGKAPGSEKWNWQEKEMSNSLSNTKMVYNVISPTLTVYMPDSALVNGTAVIVAPGGGFHILSMDNEGINVAKWLNTKGIIAFILKYRLVHSLTDDPVKELLPKLMNKKKFNQDIDSVVTMAIADGKKAVEYVRSHAGEYKIDPARIGFVGFSAGGTVTMGVGMSYNKENRPDFLVPVYPYIEAFPKVVVPIDAPPVFIVATQADNIVPVEQSAIIFSEWTKAKVPAELHIFEQGPHGFGMNKLNLPVDQWTAAFEQWLKSHGLISKSRQ